MSRTDNRIGRVAMLSTHGYFDPVPKLGRTDTGGQVVFVLELAKALSRLGIETDIYTRWFDQSQPQIDPVPDSPSTRVIRIPAGPWEFIDKEEIYDVLPELAANMTTFIREQKLDYALFHGHYVDAGIVTLDVATALGKPAFFTAHSLGGWKRQQMGGDPDEMEAKFRFRHRITEELRIFNSVAAQTVTSIVQRDKLDELYGFSADNVAVIPPGVDLHRFRPLSEGETNINTNLPARYVFCLSRIDSNKGHDLLLYAFDIVRREVPDIHLVIGGGSASPEEREAGILSDLRSIIKERNMADCVSFSGYVSDDMMAPTYRHAQMFVLPSLFEPFGMTAQEAMACGVPVVASRLGGIRDVITTGENGLLVDPSDTEEFAAGMIRLLEDDQLRTAIGTAGLRSVVDNYSWEAIASRFIAFYEQYLPSG